MKDAARRNKMQRVRWDVLEFTYDHVRHDKAYVAEEVGAHLLA
jgi:very-short-patch-repair endonuclease